MDSVEIIKHCLKEYFLQENSQLCGLVNYYKFKVRNLELQLHSALQELTQRNHTIARMEWEIQRLQETRITVLHNGVYSVFRRNEDGFFVMVPIDAMSSSSIAGSEDPEDIARRLDFLSDSETESDLLEQLERE